MRGRRVRAAVGVLVMAAAACTGSQSPHAQAPAPHPRSTTSPRHRLAVRTSPPKPPSVTVLGTGDVLIHPQLWQQANRDARAEGRHGYDFGPMYASIAPDVRPVDLAICEMESPLAPPQGPFSGWPQFSSPPQVLTALKAVGYNSCTTASNHTIDQGYAGVKRTLDELDRAGIKHTGSARSAAEAARPLLFRFANGITVAQLAYSFGFNQLTVPPGEPWLANYLDVPTILRAARRAKQAGADIVVLSLHWGVEYNRGVTTLQREQAHELLRSPNIDLILGDHPHVVEPAERIDGKWVIYSMGNQISRHQDPILVSRLGAMAEFTFTEVRPHRFRVTRAHVIPTLMQLGPPLRLVDLPRAVRARPNRYYDRCIRDVRRVIDALGAGRDGMTVG